MIGCELIAAERQRQIDEEGWDEGHDSEHGAGDLAIAGAVYAGDAAQNLAGLEVGLKPATGTFGEDEWPWSPQWWKPTPDDPVRQLVKAGALIAAEIDRIHNAESEAPSE